MSDSPYSVHTPETVWVAQEVRRTETAAWWVVDELPARTALLMSECEQRFALVLQERLRADNKPPALWREWYTLHRMGYAEACALAGTLPPAHGKPVVATLLLPPSPPHSQTTERRPS